MWCFKNRRKAWLQPFAGPYRPRVLCPPRQFQSSRPVCDALHLQLPPGDCPRCPSHGGFFLDLSSLSPDPLLLELPLGKALISVFAHEDDINTPAAADFSLPTHNQPSPDVLGASQPVRESRSHPRPRLLLHPRVHRLQTLPLKSPGMARLSCEDQPSSVTQAMAPSLDAHPPALVA